MGKIQVTIEQAQRMKAIMDLAEAVKLCARALSLPPNVVVQDCIIHADAEDTVGILIDTAQNVGETIIKEISEDAGGE